MQVDVEWELMKPEDRVQIVILIASENGNKSENFSDLLDCKGGKANL